MLMDAICGGGVGACGQGGEESVAQEADLIGNVVGARDFGRQVRAKVFVSMLILLRSSAVESLCLASVRDSASTFIHVAYIAG